MATDRTPETETEATSLDEILERGEELRRSGDHDEGIRLLLDALSEHPDTPLLYFRLGNIYFDKGNLEHAEHCYTRAIKCDPDYTDALNNLAVVYKRQGKISKSVQTFRRMRKATLRPDPSDRRATGRSAPGPRAIRILGSIAVIVALVLIALRLLR